MGVGRLLEQLQLSATPIDTMGFRTMLALKDTVAGDSFDLFYGLYKYNPNSIDTLLLLRKALVDLECRLTEMDKKDMGTPGWKIRSPYNNPRNNRPPTERKAAEVAGDMAEEGHIPPEINEVIT